MKTTIAWLIGLSIAVSLATPRPAEQDQSSVEVENTVVVPSGTYQGTAYRVDPKEEEIYVQLDDGRIIELYLQESTKILRSGQTVPFKELEKGQQLEVDVEKQGDRLKPLEVRIGGRSK